MACCCGSPECCGVLCSEMPAELTATVEFYDTDCGACTVAVTLTKQDCTSGTAIYTATGADCNGADGANSIGFLELRCLLVNFTCGTVEDPLTEASWSFRDDVHDEVDYVLDLETACCSPLFLEFNCNPASFCVPSGMGSPGGKIRVTITE